VRCLYEAEGQGAQPGPDLEDDVIFGNPRCGHDSSYGVGVGDEVLTTLL